MEAIEWRRRSGKVKGGGALEVTLECCKSHSFLITIFVSNAECIRKFINSKKSNHTTVSGAAKFLANNGAIQILSTLDVESRVRVWLLLWRRWRGSRLGGDT